VYILVEETRERSETSSSKLRSSRKHVDASECGDIERLFIYRLLNIMNGDLRVEIIKALINVDFISYRLLAKKLRVNYGKMTYALDQLSREGLVELLNIEVSSKRTYRACRLRPEFRKLLRDIFNSSNL